MTEDSSSTTAAPLYTSRIIKASALIADTRLLLAEWDTTRPAAENLDRVRRQNVLGKASRSRIEDILVIFRQRYFDDPDVGGALVTLAQGDAPSGWIDPLLYFFAVQNDRVLHDLVTEVLYDRQLAGLSDIPADVINRQLRNWAMEGKTASRWADSTIQVMRRLSLAALRDFGVLQGRIHKRITPIYLPTPAFAVIAHWLHRREGSGDRTLHSDDWKLFFLPVAGVERLFIEAHQEHLLTYHAAGSVVRIDFPATSLTEYAHVLLARANQRLGG